MTRNALSVCLLLLAVGCARRAPAGADGTRPGAPAAAIAPADAPDHDDEVPVALEDLPPAVVDAIRARWPGATLSEAEREDATFEVEITTSDGRALEVEVAPDGTILEVEDHEGGPG